MASSSSTTTAPSPAVVRDVVHDEFSSGLGEPMMSALTGCVLDYLETLVVDFIQDTSGSVEENDVVQSVSLFLVESGLCDSLATASEQVRALLRAIEARGCVRVHRVDVRPLQAPVHFDKFLSDSSAKTVFGYGSAGIETNTNEDINWADDEWKLARKAKKDAKQREKHQREIEERMSSRSNASSFIKVHPTGARVTGKTELVLNNFDVSVGNRTLIEGANLQLAEGHRYGLVGKNGIGKSTLLHHLASRDIPGIPDTLQILHVEQEVMGDDTSVLDSVLMTDVERLSLLKEEAELTLKTDDASARRLQAVHERLLQIEADTAESKASEILAGLGFSADDMRRPTKQFSGGWRMRVSLARALFCEADILCLDEPTNHLDLFAVMWLEDYLMNYEKTLVVVSHARDFLNSVVTDIIHVHDRTITQYRGDYETFDRTRKDALMTQDRMHDAQAKQRAHIQTFIDRFRYNAKRARMVQSRIKLLEKMEFIPAVIEDPSFSFSFPVPEPCAPPILQVIDVAFGYSPDKLLFRDVDFGIDCESRIALVGPNGAGKSTFLNLLTQELQPTKGMVVRSGKARIVRFTQHHVDQLNLVQTPIEYMLSKYPMCKEQQVRAHLGSMGVTGDMQLQPIYTLSGGQKSRVAFAYITFQKPHVLLLDEPTNHLDLDTVEALIAALNEYEGGILLVSHDQHFISAVCDEIWECNDGAIRKFSGDFMDYRKSLEKQLKLQSR